MIHDPLLNIDKLRLQDLHGQRLTEVEWDSIRNDMNVAVCFFLRLQERGALRGHNSIAAEIKAFLGSREDDIAIKHHRKLLGLLD